MSAVNGAKYVLSYESYTLSKYSNISTQSFFLYIPTQTTLLSLLYRKNISNTVFTIDEIQREGLFASEARYKTKIKLVCER